jgi:putative nucleotidyltransferase with HDIG domain
MGLVLGASASAAGLLLAGHELESPPTVLVLAASAALAERASIRFAVTRRGLAETEEQSIHLLPTLFAAVVFGPLAAAVVGAASMLGDFELVSRSGRERAPRLKWAAYSSTRFMTGAAMGLIAANALEITPSKFGGLLVASLAGAIVGETLDVLFAALTARVRGRPMIDAMRTLAPRVLPSAPLYTPLVALLGFMYVEVSPWSLVLFLIPAMAAQRLYGLYQQERRLAADLTAVNATLERANLQFAGALITTLDARDEYTAGHSAAVAIYSRDIAARMGLPEEIQEQAYLCGLVHDIGKIGLPAGLLEKPGALTLEERRQMQEHSAIGERILRNVDEYSEVATIVRHHHERIDGEGYPDGLAGDEIPLVSRIIAVADAYNAMTSNRPYRDAMPSSTARHRLGQAVGSQLDTDVVMAFEAILASATEDYRLARAPEFQFGRDPRDDESDDGDASVAAVA